jgi:hypothetical protein
MTVELDAWHDPAVNVAALAIAGQKIVMAACGTSRRFAALHQIGSN